MRFATVLLLTMGAGMALCAEEPAQLPKIWRAESKDRIADALQVWRLGENYFQAGSEDDENLIRSGIVFEAKTKRTFDGYNAWTREFLIGPRLAPGVQFSCARGVCHEEDVVKQALKNAAAPEIQLQALALLIKVRSPSSIKDQWATLQELKKLDKGPLWKTLLSELESAFNAGSIEAALKDWSPPLTGFVKLDEFSNLPAHTAWLIRAAGVIQCQAVLPLLRKWSTQNHLQSNLEAEWSLEQFEGAAADEALAYCLKSWQYNAAEKAAKKLSARNPKLLADTLLAMGTPKDRVYIYAMLLAETGDARAVPMLCATVKEISIVDGGMFHFIETLARKEDVPLIKELPGKVRENQRARAEQVVKAVLKKYP